MTTTHALLPLAVAAAVVRRRVPWRLIVVASLAAAAPDIDGAFKHFFGVPPHSIYSHRGATHSVFAAIVIGLIAAAFHRWLRVPALTAGAAVGGAAASHGLLDMMTDGGQGVAYLWPIRSFRLFADWRPIHSTAVHRAHLIHDIAVRVELELWQLIIPMILLALAVRWTRFLVARSAL
jgi:inner membrane protein